MIIAPHPDDAELAMGGTIAKMTHEGHNVILIDLTNGEPTPYGSIKIRSKEAHQAAKILHLGKRLCLNMPNRCLKATLQNRKKLAETIRVHRPDILFGPALPDRHPDHVQAAALIEDARFQAKYCKSTMRGLPHWVPGLFYYYSVHRACHDKPSFIIDISEFWEHKINAIEAYQSQLRNTAWASISLLERVDAVCRYFGQCIDCRYAEPFTGPEPLGIKDIDFLNQF